MSVIHELHRRNVLRVAAAYVVGGWLVVQVVETVAPAFGFGDAALRLTVLVLAIGLVPVLIGAWAFEWTPQGLKKDRDVDRRHSVTATTGKTIDRLMMVGLALAVAFFAFDRLVLSPARESTVAEQARHQGRTEALVHRYGDHSIVVLPFADMSPDGDQEYFADGIAEELLNLLARIPELRVISRSSAFSYKGQAITITDVARDLNVGHVLEGSVRKAGNTVRLTAQLIDARADTHLWSETYDRPLDDVFAVQDELSAMVVAQLRVEMLGPPPTSLATDSAAYETFLRARHLQRQGSRDSRHRSQELLAQVLDIDPHYVPAISALGAVYLSQANSGARGRKESYALVQQLVQRGLEIDPGFVPLYGIRAYLEMYYEGDVVSAAVSLTRARALDSTETRNMGLLLSILGRTDDALRVQEYTIKRNPLSPASFVNYSLFLLSAGRSEDAVQAVRRVLELSPGFGSGQYVLSLALLADGQPAMARDAAHEESIEAYRQAGLTLAHHALGDTAASDAALAALIENHADDRPVEIAQAYAFRGEADAAFRWLTTAADEGHPELMELHASVLYRNLHSDPRWAVLLDSIGLSPEQLARTEFEVTLPD